MRDLTFLTAVTPCLVYTKPDSPSQDLPPLPPGSGVVRRYPRQVPDRVVSGADALQGALGR